MIKHFVAILLFVGAVFAITIEQLPSTLPTTYTHTIDSAAKSVVYIMTPTDERAGVASPFIEDVWFKPYLQFPQLGLSSQKLRRSIGSGVLISQDGLIVTSSRFIENRKSVKVMVPNHPEPYDAVILGSDQLSDLAVLRIIADDLTPIKLSENSSLQSGEILFSIGNPFGLEPVVSMGVVSTSGKYLKDQRVVQSDLFIHGGNIGGAIINTNGELAGVAARLKGMSKYEDQGGFFLPIDRVKDIASRISRFGSVKESWLGIAVADLSQETKSYYQREEGVLVTAVEPYSPAEKAGIKKGDLIILADDIIVDNIPSFERIVTTLLADRELSLLYLRDKRIHEASLTVGRLEGTALRGGRMMYHHGMILETLNREWQERLKLNEITKGVVVADIEPSSKASGAGFAAGDVIVQAGGREISTLSTLQDILNKEDVKEFLIMRGGLVMSVVIKDRLLASKER